MAIGNAIGIPFKRGGINWNLFWTSRKRIPITGSAGAGSNYQIMVEVNSGNGADSIGKVYLNGLAKDFPNDIVFTDSDGTTKIPFWIDTVLGTATQKFIWIRPTDDLSAGTQYIYIYYGKPAGTTGVGLTNGTNTFNFFEDFEGSIKTSAVENAITYAEFIDLINSNKYASNPIIVYGGGGWKDSQLHYAYVLDDPADASKLIMWVGGMAAPVKTGDMSIGVYYANKSDPYTWTPYGSNPVIVKGTGGQWDDSKVLGPNSVIWNPDDSLFYLYYTGYNADGLFEIGLATSPADGVTFTKSASNPILIAAGQGRNDGMTVLAAGVLREDATHWYMYYTYTNASAVFAPGIRIASSADGITWTKQGAGDIISKGAAGTYDGKYTEGCQILKFGSKYVLIYNGYDNVNDQWCAALASSDSWNTGWTKYANNPIFKSYGVTGDWDRSIVSTYNVFKINNKWYGFYQGAVGDAVDYNDEHYSIGITSFDSVHYLKRLNSQRSWVANELFGIDSRNAKSGILSTHITRNRILSGNATNTVVITNTLGELSLYFMDDTYGAAGKLTISGYVYEGATVITGFVVKQKMLQHLAKTVIWQDIQTVVEGVWHKIAFRFPTKSTHKIYVDDVEKVGLATANYNDITTKIDTIKIERYDIVAGTAYFDLIKLREYITSEPAVGTPEVIESGQFDLG